MSSLTILNQHEAAFFRIDCCTELNQQHRFPYQSLMDKYVDPHTMRQSKHLFLEYLTCLVLHFQWHFLKFTAKLSALSSFKVCLMTNRCDLVMPNVWLPLEKRYRNYGCRKQRPYSSVEADSLFLVC